MATAAPHVKLLRQLASAKDDYLSGAFDISWDGAKATLFLVFGRPSHAVFETGQEQIEGEAAIDALLAELPRAFAVSDWRRAMSPQETLSITIDELAGPFVRLAGSYADDPVSDESPEWWSAGDDSPDLAFGLADFPLLPGGRPLWTEASPEEVHLADRIAGLPPSILILTGAKLRAAAVVSGGDLIDAVWIDADDQARGESASMAILGATKGSLAGYALDDPRVAEALTMLWRIPLAVSGVDLSWLDPASMLAAFRADGLDRVLVIDAPVRGIALFSRGGLVAVYSETQRSAVASPERLRSLLSQARGRLTVMERKPRPLPSETAQQPLSAHEFFAIAPADPARDAVVETAPEPAPSEPAEAVPAEAGVAEAVDLSDQAHEETDLDTLAPAPESADGELAAAAGTPPPPPPPVASAQPLPRQKRSRWGFGRSRRSRSDPTAEESAQAAAEAAASTGADSPSSTGWSIRQPNSEPQPAWQRSRDPDESPVSATPAAPPPPDDAAVPGWSVVSPQTAAPSEGGAPVEIAVSSDAAAAPDESRAAAESTDFELVYADDPSGSVTTDPGTASWASVTWLDDAVEAAANADEPAEASRTDEREATLDLPLSEDEPEPATAALEGDRDHGAQWPAAAARPSGPWSWPLAEAEESHPIAAPEESVLTHAQNEDEDESDGFFRRDEPVGSQFVDFDEVRDELIQIGVVWLGDENARQVTALLTSTRSTIDDFVATIDTIRGLQVDGQDPASIQAMAREMHQQAAERLCGA